MFNRFERYTDIKIHNEGMKFVCSSMQAGVPYDWYASHPAHANDSAKVLAVSDHGHVVEIDLSDDEVHHSDFAIRIQEVLNRAVKEHRIHLKAAEGFFCHEASLDAFIVSVLKESDDHQNSKVSSVTAPLGFDSVLYSQ